MLASNAHEKKLCLTTKTERDQVLSLTLHCRRLLFPNLDSIQKLCKEEGCMATAANGCGGWSVSEGRNRANPMETSIHTIDKVESTWDDSAVVYSRVCWDNYFSCAGWEGGGALKTKKNKSTKLTGKDDVILRAQVERLPADSRSRHQFPFAANFQIRIPFSCCCLFIRPPIRKRRRKEIRFSKRKQMKSGV